ncbi:MAG TPA: diacylglycerol kinase family lipid kinase [Armatimonadetes bacterium]|nr:diacylglycerol kinase family lipid kinase [Armatimonadota bacterium]
MPRAYVILNPRAGRWPQGGDEEAFRRLLREYGWPCELALTRAPGEATRLARAAAERGEDLVIAAGGDGTVHEVVNGLAGSETALAILPLGTENILARDIGVPRQLEAACESLRMGQVQTIDLGRTPRRYFLLMAGVGFDAQVVRETSLRWKRYFRSLTYFLTGLATWCHYRPTPAQVRVDGTENNLTVWGVIISNATRYAWRVRIAPTASLTDGRLDVLAFTAPTPLAFARDVLGAILTGRMRGKGIQHWTGREIVVQPARPLPVQLDGELVEEPKLRFTLVPQALRLLRPTPAFAI